ncbi:tectonic-1 [Hoplias malabaricus]|uniref:tectonic-1 n=1 Tax=Hoplias malabaricus TaxID=27720 RepID=UPI0034618368
MAAVFWMFVIFIYLRKIGADSDSFNATNRTWLNWTDSENVTEQPIRETSTLTVVSMPAASAETPEPTADSELARAATAARPLPLSGALPEPVTQVSEMCPCNIQTDQCDMNCCCDPDCSQDRPLFTHCSVQKVTGDPRLCSQDAAVYSLSTTSDSLSQVQTSVQREVNPDVFCLQSANYKQGLSFVTPNTPTAMNFDDLFTRFVGLFFGSSGAAVSALQAPAQGNSPGYLFGDVIQTEDEAGQRSYFRLPSAAGTANCLDSNPAAFLQDQKSKCVRSFALAQDCTTLQALNLKTYINFHVFSGKDTEANLVSVGVEAVTVQSLDGTQTETAADSALEPTFLRPAEVCNQVVLQVKYSVVYGDVGQIVRVTASFVLGAVNSAMLPIQQDFQIAFAQEARKAATLRSSGNPGYVLGLPLVAGVRTAQGIIQSSNPESSLTVLQSSADQDCVFGSPQRSPVLFGKGVLSGCTFRLEDGANCSLVSEVILGRLKGQSSPDYVASFGNSLPQNPMDWVPIENQTTATGSQGCSIPLSYHLQVKWTKYGTLVNPQAQIVNVMEIIKFNTSTLPSSSSSSGANIISVTSSVSFLDVSASASPGFRAPPTINAKLPFDFFFPFV